MTNADRIRNMSNEELTELISDSTIFFNCNKCSAKINGQCDQWNGDCIPFIRMWMESEIECDKRSGMVIKDKEAINFLLNKEIEIMNRIHNAITEIMRLGIESERGKKVVTDAVDSIRYYLDDLERILNR